jgi:SNF family Na+-dependent transporter
VFRGIHPRLAGVGLASVLASFCIVAYYNVIIAWSLIYLIAGFYDPLPWSVQNTVDVGQSHKLCQDIYITTEFFYKDLVRTINENCEGMNTSTMIVDESIFGWK